MAHRDYGRLSLTRAKPVRLVVAAVFAIAVALVTAIAVASVQSHGPEVPRSPSPLSSVSP